MGPICWNASHFPATMRRGGPFPAKIGHTHNPSSKYRTVHSSVEDSSTALLPSSMATKGLDFAADKGNSSVDFYYAGRGSLC